MPFKHYGGGDGFAIVPGNAEASEVWDRIHSTDPDFAMPPPDSHLTLSAQEKSLLGEWIEQGADWEEHWAFVPPDKGEIPTVDGSAGWNDNPIDSFILDAQRRNKLRHSPRASRETLIRRLCLDLTGLPPSLSDIHSFLQDDSPLAYENLVDRYLHSIAHAERLALEWMDVARYGDTQGMHGDRERHHWPWRDWVIEAFLSNLPYDEFITWQMAGDLLPQATRAQKLATAFHRNHPVSAEGGIIDEEFRIKYVQDRVNTTSSAFLGLTMECAACHDHKFDPISQKEYYQMSAFFNNVKEIGMVAEGGGSSGPVLHLPSQEQEESLLQISQEIVSIQNERMAIRNKLESTFQDEGKDVDGLFQTPTPDAVFPLDTMRSEPIKVQGAIHRAVRNTPINLLLDDNQHSVASGAPELVPGKMGKALKVVKEYDILFLREGGTFDLNQPFSSGLWIHPEKKGENQTLLGISGNLTNHAWRGWDFFLDRENRLSLRLIGFWPHNYLQVTSESAVELDEWTHVMFSYDGTASASGVQLFVNGKKVSTVSPYDRLYGSLKLPWNKQEGWPEQPVMVGRSGRFYTGDNGVFEGVIDHIQWYRQALSSVEAGLVYASLLKEETDLKPFSFSARIDHYLKHQHREHQALLERQRALVEERMILHKAIP